MEIKNVTLNPNDLNGNWLLSNENLTATVAVGTSANIRATHGKKKGKWYWEVKLDSGAKAFHIGIANKNYALTLGATNTNIRSYYGNDGNKHPEATSYGTAINVGDVIGVALDMDLGTLEFYKNGVSMGVSHSDLKGIGELFPFFKDATSATKTFTVNFGGTPFVYPIPTGHMAYNIFLEDSKLILKNPTTNQHYSLAEKTLIPLPDSSPKNMILHGIEAGKEIQLDEDFNKLVQISPSENREQLTTAPPFNGYVYKTKISHFIKKIKIR